MSETSNMRPRLIRYRVVLELAQKPLFCCCCIGLTGDDAARLKRILALTRAIRDSWR